MRLQKLNKYYTTNKKYLYRNTNRLKAKKKKKKKKENKIKLRANNKAR